MLTGCGVCVGGSVDCSDWLRADCAVDFSPGEVRIGYIRPRLWTDSLIDAAPVTGSLIDSALSDCLIVLCIAGFSSTWTFCSTLSLTCWICVIRPAGKRLQEYGSGRCDVGRSEGWHYIWCRTLCPYSMKRWWMFHRRVSCP